VPVHDSLRPIVGFPLNIEEECPMTLHVALWEKTVSLSPR
jgi:hypothetical protein